MSVSGVVGSVSPDTEREIPPFAGESNPAAKLTPRQVEAIRIAASAGGRITYLAAAFGVSPRTVRHIRNGTSWGHIGGAGR